MALTSTLDHRGETRQRRRRSAAPAPLPDSGPKLWDALPLLVLLGSALLLGGSDNPLGDMAIELIALAALGVMLVRFSSDQWRASRLGWIAVLIVAGIGIVELAPLPYGLWASLPGRAWAANLFATLAIPAAARPLTLDAHATEVSLLQLIPALVAFIGILAAPKRLLKSIVLLILGATALNVLLGTLQLSGGSAFYPYTQSHFGNVTGLFANRDHAADMLLIGIAFAAATLDDLPRDAGGARILVIALLVVTSVAVLLTSSRFGIALLLLEAPALLLCSRYRRLARGKLLLAGGIVSAGCAVWLLALSSRVSAALDRFNELPEDLRPQIWHHSLAALAYYWPMGSGLGTFVPVYQRFEPLDTLTKQIINHAHCEYIELVLELGALGAGLIVAYLAFVGFFCWRAWGSSLRLGRFAAIGIATLLLHSIVDFPTRDEALMVMFAVLNALLVVAATGPRRTEDRDSARSTPSRRHRRSLA